MGRHRYDLHALLMACLPEGQKAYYQPPENLQMTYPCIVYSRERTDTKFADNSPYNNTNRYQITIIDLDPDSTIRDEVAKLPMTLHDRSYVSDGLNHDVYNTYF